MFFTTSRVIISLGICPHQSKEWLNMANYNFTTSGLAGMLGDYSSIRNGSYSKLMKKYYSSVVNTGTSTKSSSNVLDEILAERKNPKVSAEVSTANSKLSSAVGSMKSAVSTLQSAGTYENTSGGADAASKTQAALKGYVSFYNAAIESSKKSSMNTVSSNLAAIMTASSENQEALQEVGITINSDGTLSLDEATLKSVDVSKVQELFSTDDALGYGAKVSFRINRASYYTDNVSETASSTEATAASASKDLSGSIEAILKEDASFEGDSGLSMAEDFIKNYNVTINSAKTSTVSGVTSNLTTMMTKTSAQSRALAQIGITVGANGTLSLDTDTYNKATAASKQSTLQSLASGIKTNVSLMDFYASSQTTTASSYSSTGAYTSGNDIVSSLFSQSI